MRVFLVRGVVRVAGELLPNFRWDIRIGVLARRKSKNYISTLFVLRRGKR
jgi:hypothetical protein